MSRMYNHKRFKKEDLNFSKDSGLFKTEKNFNKVLKELKELKLVRKEGKTFILASNKEIKKEYGGSDKIFTYQDNLKDIKLFLRTIPVISNLYKQKRRVEELDYFSNINRRLERGQKFYMNPKLNKRYMKLHKKGKLENADLTLRLGINKIVELLGCSRNEVTKIKKFLNDNLGIRFERRVKVIDCPNLEFFKYKKEVGEIPSYATFKDGQIKYSDCSIIRFI